jgi:hypothetical protein
MLLETDCIGNMDNLPARAETHQEKIARLEWNIKDAKEALTCAMDMHDWDGVIKYAYQLNGLERSLFDADKNQS